MYDAIYTVFGVVLVLLTIALGVFFVILGREAVRDFRTHRAKRRNPPQRVEGGADQALLNPQTVTHNAQREAFR